MYLVGLTTQAAVLGAMVAAGLYFEAPIRDRLGLPHGGDMVAERVAAIDTRLDALAVKVDALSAAVGTGEADSTISGDLEAIRADVTGLVSGNDGQSLAQRIGVVERLVSRVESKLDDVRDAQLFPAKSVPRPDQTP